MKHPHLMHTLEFREPTFKQGAGTTLITDDGQEYIDLFGDVGTASVGYFSEIHSDVLQRMLDASMPPHAPNLFKFEERDRAARRLCEATEMDKVFFCNSGTEAVEAAIKMARLYQHRVTLHRSPEIWSYSGGFHGRTYGALAAGDGPSYHYEGFGALPSDFHHFDDANEIPANVAAVILAPVFGNNDVIEYPQGWLQQLRSYTEENGILLIFDEVQTGAGRCGAMTYAQKIGVKPDIITMAKGLAAGAPCGAMLAREGIAEAFTPGSHFSTFGGGPLTMAFLNGMLDWLLLPGRLEGINSGGKMITDVLATHDWAHNVRGTGMLIAYDSDADTVELAKLCAAEQVLIGAFRVGPGPVKTTPPLNMSSSTIIRGIEALDEAHRQLNAL